MGKVQEFLKDAAGREPGKEVQISIRDLLAYWGAKRRGYRTVEQIQADLLKADLETKPSFVEGWIDNRVKLVRLPKSDQKKKDSVSSAQDGLEALDRSLPDVSLRVGSLPSANLDVVSVSPQDSLDRAQALMMRHDYSQLAVMSGQRDLRGAVSWESIAQARILDPNATLREAVVNAEVVRASDDLLAQIPRIVDAGFVFVQASASDRRITGIVTTADLSNQFAVLAKPFFLLAEIERRLRRIVDGAFGEEEIASAIDPADDKREVKSAEDLTLGGHIRLFEDTAHWERLGWALERKVFIEALDQVRMIRNEVMHFSPDPLEEGQISGLENFLKWLRRLSPDS